MDFGLLPTIASLSFIIILSLVYFKKQRTDIVLNKLYKLYIIIVICFAVSQILYTISFKYIGIYYLTLVFWKLYWAFGVSCWGVVTLLIVCIMYKITDLKSIKELVNYNKKIKLLAIFYFMVPIIELIMPPYQIEALKGNELLYNSTFLAIVEVAYCGFTMGLQLVLLIINKNKIEKKLKLDIVFSVIVGTFFLILQAIFYKTSFFIPCSALYTYILYLSYTNPDIELINEINIAQNDIEKSSRTKSDFLSNMTYEIKNPLGIISSTCDSLIHAEDYNQENAKKEIQQIINSGNSLLDIVNNIVDISKLDTGKSDVFEKKYFLKELVDDVRFAMESKLENKPVKFIVELDQNISSELYGDVSKLSQILLNIISNAIMYTEVGKVTFTITSEKQSGYEKLLFKVSDTGSGIKKEDQSKIFQKGTRLKNSIENEIDGSGFGLSITKEYVDSLNGKIWFTSDYNVGSTFFVELLQKISDPTPISQLIEIDNTKDVLLDCTGFRVLIVDDNKPNIKVIKRLLGRYNFNIEFVTSGQECIHNIKGEEKYDMIFMDYFMPDMDGTETLKILRNLTGYELPPIICVTANSLSGMKESYINDGFDDYLSKPIKLNDLDKVIKKFFTKKVIMKNNK